MPRSDAPPGAAAQASPPFTAAPTPPPATTPRTRRWISLIAVLAVAALLALAWFLTKRSAVPAGFGPGAAGGQAAAGPPGGGPGGARGPGGRPGTTVGVATAVQADVPVTVEALGTVTSAATVTVRPQVSGVLQQVLFQEGQMVRAGQLLATIDPRQFEMALMQATGQRQRDEAQLENARLTLQRFQTLLQQDSIARQEVDTQAALVRQLEGTALTNRAAEGTAKLNLGYTRITAPIAGRAGLRGVDVGNLVSAGDATGIVVITQTVPIDVEFALPQDRVPQVQARMASGAVLSVEALDRGRARVLARGQFSTLDNLVDVQTGTVRAKARFANADAALFPNQFVNVRLLLQTLSDAVVVPVAALRNGQNGEFVFVLDAEARTVSMRPVQRATATDTQVVIASGLKAGEQVITEGADRLKDGARVVLPGDAPAAGFGGGRRERGEAASAPMGGFGASRPGRRASAPGAP